MLTYVPPLVLLAAALAAHELRGIDFGDISRDPVQQVDAVPLTGVQSTIGGVVWFCGATAGFLAVLVLRHQGLGGEDRTRFLARLSLFTLVMGVDDLFLLHDGLVPWFLGTDERPVLAFYGLCVVVLAVRYWRTVLRLEPGLLVLALGLFAGSLVIDHFQEQLGGHEYRIFFEDAFKLLGILGWASYLTRQGWFALTFDHIPETTLERLIERRFGPPPDHPRPVPRHRHPVPDRGSAVAERSGT